MYYIYIENPYGIEDGWKMYYRKSGINCFDFVNSIEYASELTEEEVNEIMEYSEDYKKMYNASKMGFEIIK